MRLDRLLAIVIKLLNQDRVNARDLAEHFDVSIRTIYRDLDAINLAGIPVVAFAGNQGGYGIMENYRIDKQFLGLKDLVSVCAVLKGVNTVMGDRRLDAAADKLANLVPREQAAAFKGGSERLAIDVLPWGVDPQAKRKLALIQSAAADQKLLCFDYHSSQGKTSRRTVEPMTVIFKGYVWYLYAYCRLRRDFRIFRISRIGQPKILTTTFTRRPGSYQPLLQDESPTLRMVTLSLRFGPGLRFRVEDYFSANPVKYQPDGSALVSVRMPENEWLYNFLLSHGEDLEVLKPERVRRQLLGKLAKTMAVYNGKSATKEKSRK